MSKKAPNPFNPKSVVSPTLFAGRTKQVSQILKRLAQVKEGTPSSFFLLGERGIGKTALSKLLIYIAQENDPELYNLNLLTAYYPIERGQDTRAVLQASLNELTDQMTPTVLNKIKEHVGDLLKNGKFAIGAFGGSMSIETNSQEKIKEVSIRDQVISILSNVIVAIKESEDNKKDGVLLVIDEVNNLADIENAAQMIRGIVTALDVKGKGNISFVLIGYKDTEKAFFDGDESARRQFDEVALEPMPNEEAIQVLEKGFNKAGISWDKKIMKESISVTGGFPHSIQLLGHNLYELNQDGHIVQKDWNEAITETAIQLQTKGFASMYNFHGKKGQREELLDVLVSKEGRTKSELSKECPDKLNIYRLIPKLKEEGSIREDEEGRIFISSQLLRVAIMFSNFFREMRKMK